MTETETPAVETRNGQVTDSLAAALALFQTEIPEIRKSERATVRAEKDGKVTVYSYTYANLAGVTKIAMPLLGKYGLSFSAKPTLNPQGKFVLAYVLRHSPSGETDEGEWPLPANGTPQQIGGHITYARRYALCAVTGIAPEEDDDDAAAASQQEQERPSQQGRGKTAQRRQRTATANGAPANGTPREQTAAGPPPLPGEDRHEQQRGARPNLTDLHAAFTRLRVKDRDDGLAIIAEVTKRPVASSKELTQPELITLVNKLREVEQSDEPPLAVAEMVERGREIRTPKDTPEGPP